MDRLSLKTAVVALFFVGVSILLQLDGANAQQGTPGDFVILSTAYQDLDGDLDMFPDTGETGRVSVTIQNIGTALTGVTFILTTTDQDVACITEGLIDIPSVAGGEILTISSLDPPASGFAFRASDALESFPPGNIATIDLCLRALANEIDGLSNQACFSLPADLDLPPGPIPPPTLGPDGLVDTADDGIVVENFDIDKSGDGVFSVGDTFLQGEEVDGTITYSGTPGFYLRGSDDAAVMNTVTAVACAGFTVPPDNITCVLDPDFPLDWHFHCPSDAANCPNDEILPGDTAPRICAGGCFYDTPLNDELALSLPNSLHMGAHFNLSDRAFGNTTHLRALQAFVSSPINLTPLPPPGDFELSFFHIIDLTDHNVSSLPVGHCGDCAQVQIQTDLDPAPEIDQWGFWDKLIPFKNVYDHIPDPASFRSYCLFTPADTGDAPPAPRGVHETICSPQGAYSNCGSDTGTSPDAIGDCRDGPGIVDPSGSGVWVESKFDLTSFLGQRIRIRWIGMSWRMFDAGSYYEIGGTWGDQTQDDGWWLDDIQITGTVQSQLGPTRDETEPPPTTCPPGICLDFDGDGYGLPGHAACPGVTQADCDDNDPSVFPGAPQICDGINNDCDDPLWPRVPDGETRDSDRDGVLNACDNCPFQSNADQHDFDGDGVGDRCDINDGFIYVVIVLPTGVSRIVWQPEAGFTAFNVYRGKLLTLLKRHLYTQRPQVLEFCNQEGEFLDDRETPDIGQAVFYLVTGVGPDGESSLGTDSAGFERPNDNPCP